MPENFTNDVVYLMRKLHILYQAWRRSRLARKSLARSEIRAAQIAIAKYDELTAMLNQDDRQDTNTNTTDKD